MSEKISLDSSEIVRLLKICTSKSSGVILYTIRTTPELFEVRLSLVV